MAENDPEINKRETILILSRLVIIKEDGSSDNLIKEIEKKIDLLEEYC